MVSKLERDYQQYLVVEIYKLFPEWQMLRDIMVIINDPNYIQGISDLLVLAPHKYAFLEAKLSEKSKQQPNQQWYIDTWGRNCAFTGFIYPENEKEVLDALQSALRA